MNQSLPGHTMISNGWRSSLLNTWEIWELFQIAAWASRELENENWKGPHPDHDNLKFFEKDSWEMTAIPIGSDYFGICYINK